MLAARKLGRDQAVEVARAAEDGAQADRFADFRLIFGNLHGLRGEGADGAGPVGGAAALGHVCDGEFPAEGERAVAAAVAEGVERDSLDEHRAVEREFTHAFADRGEFESRLHALPECFGQRLAVAGHGKAETFGQGFEAEAGHDGFFFAAPHQD